MCAKTWNVVGNFLAREQELMLCYAMFERVHLGNSLLSNCVSHVNGNTLK